MQPFGALWSLLLASQLTIARRHPICVGDLSTVPLNMHGLLMRPVGFEDRALRPGLLNVQADVCRCLPRRRRHHPDAVMARLHIAPNKGEIQVEYILQSTGPRTRPQGRMVPCLGTPTLRVEPMPYRSDMRDANGSADEVLVYPILLQLTE